MKNKDNPKRRTFFIVVGIIIGILSLLTLILHLWQTPYVIKEVYSETVPYTDIEYYTETVGATNCDYTIGCSCLHYAFLGLGRCDSCSCSKTREVVKYREVGKERDVTRYCSALKKITQGCS